MVGSVNRRMIVGEVQRQLHRAVLGGRAAEIGRLAELLGCDSEMLKDHGERHEEEHGQPERRREDDQRAAGKPDRRQRSAASDQTQGRRGGATGGLGGS